MTTSGRKQLTIGSVDLAYDDEGAGAPPLLLLHGYTGAASDFADVTPPLAASRRVVAYDQRGHGDSTNTGDAATYTFDQLTDDLTGFVDALDLAPIDLLGHSMGGIIAMRYVLAHPERVRSLVLMDTAAAPAGAMPKEIRDGLVQARPRRGHACGLRGHQGVPHERGHGRSTDRAHAAKVRAAGSRGVRCARGRTRDVCVVDRTAAARSAARRPSWSVSSTPDCARSADVLALSIDGARTRRHRGCRAQPARGPARRVDRGGRSAPRACLRRAPAAAGGAGPSRGPSGPLSGKSEPCPVPFSATRCCAPKTARC